MKRKTRRKGRGRNNTKKIGIQKFLKNREIGLSKKSNVKSSLWLKPSYYNKMSFNNRRSISPNLTNRAAVRRRPKIK